MNYINEFSKTYVARVEQYIAMVIKPKPRFIPYKLWLKLASIFVYIEKTQPNFKLEQKETTE